MGVPTALIDLIPGIREGAGFPTQHSLVAPATSAVANQVDSFSGGPGATTFSRKLFSTRRDGTVESLVAVNASLATVGTGTGGTTFNLTVNGTSVVIPGSTVTMTVAAAALNVWADLRDANGNGYKLMPGDVVYLNVTAIPGTTASTGLNLEVMGINYGVRG